MKLGAARWLLGTGMVFAAASAYAVNDWGDMAVISSTMGVGANRICIGEGLRASDIGCPTYAPSITTAGDVSVTGNLSAAKFIGDGSGLTGITAASSDRIVSGTTSLVAISNTGYISLTQSGVNTGWFNPQTGFVTIGVSSTGPISGTSGYFTSGVFGTGGQAWTGGGNSIFTVRSSVNAQLYSVGSSSGFQFWLDDTPSKAARAILNASGDLSLGTFNGSAWSNVLNITNSNNRVGIGTTAPSETLHISGTARIISNVSIGMNATPSATLDVSGTLKIAGTGSEGCNGTTLGMFRRNPTTGAIQVCASR